jgi:hypothetical protein
MQAERKLGQLMAAQRTAELMAKGTQGQGNPDWLGGSKSVPLSDVPDDEPPPPITLAEAGIDKHLAQRAREAAALPTRHKGVISFVHTGESSAPS